MGLLWGRDACEQELLGTQSLLRNGHLGFITIEDSFVHVYIHTLTWVPSRPFHKSLLGAFSF